MYGFIRGRWGRVGFEIAIPNTGGGIRPVIIPTLIGGISGVGGACSVSYQCRDVDQLRSDGVIARSVVGEVQGGHGALFHLLGCGAVGMIVGVAGVFFAFLGEYSGECEQEDESRLHFVADNIIVGREHVIWARGRQFERQTTV